MDDSRAIGWGILGCGRVTERRVAPAFAGIPDAGLIAFCSRDKAKATAFTHRHGAQRAYGSFDQFLADDRIEAVYIATPNALHKEQAVRCLEAGKHVLVEKPMAMSATDAEAMAETARRNDRLLGLMHQQRMHPANMHLIRLRDDGELGKLNLLRVQIAMWYALDGNWRQDASLSGGGAAMDLAPHALDLMFEVAGEIRRVNAQIKSLQFRGDVEDYCSARLEFVDGAVGLLDVSYCAHHYGGRIEAFGSEGSFLVDGSMQHTGVYYSWFRRGQEAGPMQQSVCSTNCCQAVIEDFTDAARHGGEPSICMLDGIRVMRVIDAIYESARTGMTVDLNTP